MKIIVFPSILLFFITYIIYCLTLVPTIYWGDSAELVASGYLLDIAHPPCYPTYNTIIKLFTLLPVGNIAYRVNLLSSIFSSFSVVLLYNICIKLINKKDMNFYLAFFTSSLAFSFSFTFWLHSTKAEKYSFYIFLLLLLIYFLFLWKKENKIQYLYLFFFTLGISLTHHLLILTLIPAFIYFLLTTDYKIFLKIKNIFVMVLLFILPLTIYLYLPLRSAHNPHINWGRPQNVKQFQYVILLKEQGKIIAPPTPIEDTWYNKSRNINLVQVVSNLSNIVLLFPILLSIPFIFNFSSLKTKNIKIIITFSLGMLIFSTFNTIIMLKIHQGDIVVDITKRIFSSLPFLLTSLCAVSLPYLVVIIPYTHFLIRGEKEKIIKYFLLLSCIILIFAYIFLLYFLPSSFQENFKGYVYLQYFLKQYGFAGVIIGILGIIKFYKDESNIFLYFWMLFLLSTVFTILSIFPDNLPTIQERFCLPGYLIFSIFMGFGIKTILDSVFYISKRNNFKYPQISYILVFIFLISLFTNYKECDKSKYYFSEDYASNILKTLPKDSIFLGKSINTVFPLWYLLYVEEKRKDISLVYIDALSQNWYLENIKGMVDVKSISKTEEAKRRTSGIKNILIKNNYKSSVFYGGATYFIPEGIPQGNVIPVGIVFKITDKKREIKEDELKYFENCVYKKYAYRVMYDKNVFKDSTTKEMLEFYSSAFTKLGFIYLEQKKTNKARQQFIKAIEILPTFSEGYRGLGLVFLSEGKILEGINYYQKAIKYSPANILFREELARIYYEQGFYEECIEQLIYITKKNPEYPGAYFYLGNIYLEQGKIKNALNNFEKYSLLKPEDKEVKNYIEGLKDKIGN